MRIPNYDKKDKKNEFWQSICFQMRDFSEKRDDYSLTKNNKK